MKYLVFTLNKVNWYHSKFAWLFPATCVGAAGVFWINKTNALEFASFKQYRDFSKIDNLEETIQIKALTAEERNKKVQELEQIATSKQSSFNTNKAKIQIDENVFSESDKELIPYSISEEKIKSSVKNIPSNEENVHYYIDYLKNNEEGQIKIFVFAVVWQFDGDVAQFFYSHILLKEATIAGFKKAEYETIAKERTIKLSFSKSSYWATYSFEGSGFVVGKETNKPYYYIATNKHVVSAFVEQNDSYEEYLEHNLVPIAITEDKQTMFASSIDAKNFLNKTNIKVNYKNDINVLANNCPGHNLQQLCDLKKYTKKIELIKDYSQPFIDVFNTGSKRMNFANINHQYVFPEDLTQKVNDVFLDMVVFGIEFKNSQSDPFEKWWNLRPTQFRRFEMKDIFYNNSFGNDLTISSHVLTNNICHSEKPISLNGMHFGKSKTSPFAWDMLQKRKFSNNSQLGRIFYDSWSDLATKGSSGSAVFDKNLNVVGINWGGVLPANQNQCEEFKEQKYNVFSWLSISKEIEQFRKNEDVNKKMSDYWSGKQKQWNSYDYIWKQ